MTRTAALEPRLPDHRRSPRGLGPGLEHLPRADLAERFRAAVRRVEPDADGTVHLLWASGLTCAPCVRAAAAALGLAAERRPELAAQDQGLSSYDRLRWRTSTARDDGDDLTDDGAGPDDDRRDPDGRRVAFYPPAELGPWRLADPAAPTAALWVWLVELTEGSDLEDVAVVFGPRGLVRRLVAAVERANRAHERGQAGIVVVCGDADLRASAPPVRWDDVLLPAAVRIDLERTVREFFEAGPLYRRHGVPHRRGVLLAGPPGNGKTTILRAIRTSTGVPLVVVAADESGQADLRQGFTRAAELAPAVLCLEDVDGLVAGDGPQLSTFLNLIDGLEPAEGVLVVATTNKPEALDPAITRRPSRFDRVFLVPEPDEPLRAEYLRRQLGPGTDVADLAARTDGYSVAFLKELVLQARLAAVRRGGDAAVAPDDLEAALAATREHLRLAGRGLADRGGFGFLR